ncbi:MAG: UDP-N-acetylmuramoyl-tripeptide-D-alanyl-D-alanine ligase [Parcubacteria group bacterium GW2011_GWD2_38_12]|nr:MAG: UDP-N-acetylmuramoyl-tripeptide-D-alanyl-D-alanine ligase [Parcubacteria group bacterium GW2011_GWC2_36_17]KKQ51884.1 MAG: UDP-N-acetylmuramoyl-tripeptide-D-alanyl-D-alanine ligase [Parcubacteria group bacterium GW2011_GWD2_38_12]KKQ58664.1 MAG: UDP-N-acetylmuramoyl-tripeptide-D-alanyl-D-alanine ligase, UDP-N-acetylmuramoylalanyl-D-glutamyl-2,6-diaminopimelate-D-alanyl-D-alanine ligase [Parcubacteria group bacterium GW2011_GWC1_38_17]KKQ59433.1 MAG: UDP-N-acetylmuramoyl-tripeptide-D-alan
MKHIIEKILKFLTKRYLKRYKPKIIAITGSNGKTSAKEAIFTVLKEKFKVRRSEKNYNTEIGVPLSVLGIFAPISNLFWPLTLVRACIIAYFSRSAPEILILEMAADKPGDLKYLMSFIKPDISVITAIGELPVHIEYYSGPKAVAEEKSFLIKALDNSGVAILNFDDKIVLEMEKKTRAHVFTYGFGEGAMIRAFEAQNNLCDNGEFCGIVFKLDFEGKVIPVKIKNIYGKPFVYAALAAIVAGYVLGMNLVEIAKALEDYKSPKGRLNLIKAKKEAFIIDDTYNASPLSISAALEFLRDLPATRKIAVLGDMKELGKYSDEAHKEVGREAAKSAEYIFVVGEKGKFTVLGALERGFKKENILEFNNSVDAGKALREIIFEGDLVLIKGSQSMRMELAVEEVMAEPERKKDILVRQDWPWKDKRGNPRLTP